MHIVVLKIPGVKLANLLVALLLLFDLVDFLHVAISVVRVVLLL